MENFIEVRNVTKAFDRHVALSDVSLTMRRGRVFGLLGPNGAGKTTLIRILNRITAPDSGEVIFDGRQMQPADVARIGYLPEERGLYRKMKVGEQAVYLARLKGLSRSGFGSLASCPGGTANSKNCPREWRRRCSLSSPSSTSPTCSSSTSRSRASTRSTPSNSSRRFFNSRRRDTPSSSRPTTWPAWRRSATTSRSSTTPRWCSRAT